MGSEQDWLRREPGPDRILRSVLWRPRGLPAYARDGGQRDFDQYVAARYGRLIEHAVLQQLITDDRYDSVDWMLGIASEKILVTSGARPALVLTAASASAQPYEALNVVASSATAP